ncbi:MAG TPA: inorganic phosphate transporter [Rhodospirillales bacterium]|nr:inorganic phosphate transporter [Pseudomonadota bacterium]HIM42181.1 inorganic phosphate transporter [Rhodospirillales bacterium]
MSETAPTYKETTTKDLSKFYKLERTIHHLSARPVIGIGIAAIFLSLVWLATHTITAGVENQALIVAAGVIGGYMALNIGANDVANNVGPAFGAKSLTMVGALIIAGIFETAGAVIAGGDVVQTISKGIIDPDLILDTDTFLWAMMSAMLAAALWINFATYFGAPVSTTHSIVGGVMGAGIAAAGTAVVDWTVMAKIAGSWIISPVLGGIVAAIFLAFLKRKVLYQQDPIAAAKHWVPILIALMAGVFSAYLSVKGLKKVWKPEPWVVVLIGAGFMAATYAVVNPLIAKHATSMENTKKAIRGLFHVPLICAAALLSFAHGANDVANAVGPLAAIVNSASTGVVAAAKVEIPTWVLFVGAAGITMGLMLFGPKLIRTVGDKITRMNPMRAYCVALSAAITVIIASAMGLPVSSTHIAIGAVFGVGFFREYHTSRGGHINGSAKKADRPPSKWDLLPAEEKSRRRKLVRRQYLWTIIAAWLITVPLSAIFAGGIYAGLRAFLG